jgi:Ecdysteroid kinase-like family
VITSGSDGGHNITSILFRVKITYSSPSGDHLQTSWIVKTVPGRDGVKKDNLEDGFNFNREIFMYTTVVVEMQRLLAQAGDTTELSPRLIYSTTSPTYVLVFEDLVDRGYEVKHTLLNYEETKMAIAKLAKWHATSYYMGQQQNAIT